ncbi:hypothetical protein [Saccharophagus degradans]|uniref:Uncharacterized protein n=1 Tax=Saccharophagus degradans (strain 2-40 / ATCC 43961 / DSM 17024) TaxID=203122 RepID=Q21I79_SACD2|nr:hypothetical protein [Saccharophagus degradans]ABD81600.1 hypothetical protein Sde_2340 [Saccharophagus degradans 2-40]
MQIKELLSLSYWIDENVKKLQVVQKYQQLHKAMQQNVNARNNQPMQPFETQKDALIDAIEKISLSGLTNEQERMLSKLEISHYIGSEGVTNLEDLLFRNSLDIATATAEVNSIHGKLTQAIQKSDQLKSNLASLIDVDDEDSDEDEQVVMRVHFQNDVSLNNLTDFKKMGNTWWEIGRGIAMAHGYAPEDVKVVGAQKGSIIIELAVIAAIATTTSTIILSALKVADRVLTIRKKAEEIKALKLGNQKLEAELSKEADKEKKEGLESITKEISVNLNINQNGDGEKFKVLEKSVKNLIEFVEKGGEVDFYSPESSEDNQDVEQMKVNFAEIKKLEKRVLAIESKSS